MSSGALSDALRETLAVFETGEPMTTAEVTDRFDVSRRSTYARLDTLAERGHIETKKVGAKGRVWWCPPKGGDEPERRSAVVDGASGVEDAFERIDDAFYAVDEEFRFTYVNERAAELLRGDASGLLGESVWETLPPAAETGARASLREAFETQEPTGYELEAESGVTVEAVVYPSETGLSVYFRDVTEREARELELERYETLARTASDVIVTIDADGVVRDVNSAVEDVFGYDPEELRGESLATLMPDRLSEAFRASFRSYLSTGERSIQWENLELPGVRADGTEIPLAVSYSEYEHDGERYFTGIMRDLSDRKEVESKLRESEGVLRTLAENLTEVVWMTSEDPDDFLYVNSAYETVWDRDRERLYEEGFDFLESVHPEDRDRVREAYAALPDEDYEEQYRIVRSDGSVRWIHARAVSIGDGGGGDRRVVGIAEDATDRIERRRELQRRVRQQEVITEFGRRALEDGDPDALMSEAVALVSDTLDTDYCKILDLEADAEELRLRQGVGWDDDVVGSATVSAVGDDSQMAYTLASERPVVVENLDTESRFGAPDLLTDHDVQSGMSVVIGSPADPWGVLCTFDTARRRFSERDVNFVQSVANVLATAIDRRNYEKRLVTRRAELEERERTLRRAYEVIADPGLSLSERIDDLLEVVREAVGTEYATLSRVHEDQYVFEAISAPPDADLQVADAIPLLSTNCERVVETGRTLVLRDVESDAPELTDRAANADWGVSCYLGAAVPVGDDVYGTFCFYGMDARDEEFSDWEVTFVDILSNWVGNELERERDTDRLTALNSLNEVVRETTEVVIEQSTREEIEQTVCERLAETDSYLFAWVGDVDVPSQTVRLRTGAGVERPRRNLPLGPDRDGGTDPTSEALRSGEVQILQNVRNDPEREPWRETAERYGFRSSAAIPIAYEDTVYGVLNVYSDRPTAFEGRERTVLSQLGEIVGHAIAAVERKRALMSDEVVELEFRIPGILETHRDAPTAGAFSLDETVPLKQGEYLLYGSATEDATDALSAFVATHPHWEELTLRDDGRFEIRLSDPPILSTLASLGGSIEGAVFEEGTLTLALHLSPSVDARQLIDVVREAYPQAEMVTRKQVEFDDDPERVHETFADALTDRQRAALRAAYHAGFFEWPREASGREMADSLGVAAPTFHQHLRAAEKKMLDALLSSSVTDLD